LPERQKLRELLEDLHRELGDASSLDEGAREQLHGMMDEIRDVLEPETDAQEGLNRRLQELALRFEADHPRVSTAIRRLTDTLQKMGI
jgi:hypothetical protein